MRRVSLLLDLGSDIRVDLTTVTAPETAPRLEWAANHSTGWRPVVGGWPTLRMLCGALDGAGWPWLIVDNRDTGCSVQMLGTAEECLVEVARPGDRYRMVFRLAGQRGGWHPLPRECRFWVAGLYDDEGFTAAEASAIAVDWLRDGRLADDFGLREVRPGAAAAPKDRA